MFSFFFVCAFSEQLEKVVQEHTVSVKPPSQSSSKGVEERVHLEHTTNASLVHFNFHNSLKKSERDSLSTATFDVHVSMTNESCDVYQHSP